MVIPLLAFAKVIEAGFVYRRGPDGPGMAQIPLLHSCLIQSAETRKEPARILQLKVREGILGVIVVKIIVGAELLSSVYFVVETQGELITALASVPSRRQCACSERGHVFLIQGKRRGIETLRWNYVVGKNRLEELRGVPGRSGRKC